MSFRNAFLRFYHEMSINNTAKVKGKEEEHEDNYKEDSGLETHNVDNVAGEVKNVIGIHGLDIQPEPVDPNSSRNVRNSERMRYYSLLWSKVTTLNYAQRIDGF